ncbi:hypothetical protein Tco_0530202 [Tanacetum coccineum]
MYDFSFQYTILLWSIWEKYNKHLHLSNDSIVSVPNDLTRWKLLLRGLANMGKSTSAKVEEESKPYLAFDPSCLLAVLACYSTLLYCKYLRCRNNDPTSGIRACVETLIKKNFHHSKSFQTLKRCLKLNYPPAHLSPPLLDIGDIEIDADHVDLGQDGLGVFDWSEEADNAPIALALMATSSTDSSNSKDFGVESIVVDRELAIRFKKIVKHLLKTGHLAVKTVLVKDLEEKDTSDVKSGDTEELDLERIQSTARQSTVTPRTLNFDDEAGPSSPIRPTQEEEPEEQFKDDEFLAALNRTRGLSIPGPMQSQPQQPTQATDPKEKGKGILVEEPKKKKLTLQQIRALETANDEEVARKVQEEWDAEEERKRLEDLKKPKEVKKPKTISKKPTSLAQERTQMMNFLKGQGYKNLQKLRYPQMKELYDKVQESIKDSFKDFIPMGSEKEKQMLQERDAKRLLRKRKATVTEEQPSKKLKLRTETIDELRNYLRIVDFEKSAQDRESLEAISMITEFKVIDSPDGEYLIIYRANSHFRAFDTLWEILHILDRQDLHHLYLVVQDYYKHIPPTGLGLILLGDLTTIWETSATSDDDFWKNQEDWEIVRWRLNESSGVHTLELEDSTMIHMRLKEDILYQRVLIGMLDLEWEVEDGK